MIMEFSNDDDNLETDENDRKKRFFEYNRTIFRDLVQILIIFLHVNIKYWNFWYHTDLCKNRSLCNRNDGKISEKSKNMINFQKNIKIHIRIWNSWKNHKNHEIHGFQHQIPFNYQNFTQHTLLCIHTQYINY